MFSRIVVYAAIGAVALLFAFPLVHFVPGDILVLEPGGAMPSPLPPERLVFVFGGDVMLGRMVNWELKRIGDYGAPFRDIAPLWQDADVAMVNLESPLYQGCPVRNATSMQFCAEPVFAAVMAQAGITHVSFANNHMQDYGKKGTSDTDFYLMEQGVTVIRHGKPMVSEIKGRRIGFLSWNLTWGEARENEIIAAIQELRATVDALVVNFHWGEEYTDAPNEYQTRIARTAIERGADVVIGHHPHHIQPAETYRGKLIFYSLGNLVFDQLWSEKTRTGMLARVVWDVDTGALAYATSTTYMKTWTEAVCVSGCRDSNSD